MDSFVLPTLGIQIPCGLSRKRKLISKPPQRRATVVDPENDAVDCLHHFAHRDSLLLENKQTRQSSVNNRKQTADQDENDDDTATTLSTSESSSMDESVGFRLGSRVTFADELVTKIHYRPRTTREEKYYLHYGEFDYIDFKLEYMTGKSRSRKVSFARDVVSEIHTFPEPSRAEVKSLYYSEKDLQTFLDDFVSSLTSKTSA